MMDLPLNLGQRILELARIAAAIHEAQALDEQKSLTRDGTGGAGCLDVFSTDGDEHFPRGRGFESQRSPGLPFSPRLL